MRHRNSRLMVLSGLAALVLSACGSSASDDSASSSDAETIKIGYSGDFSGLLAAYDTPLRDGMEFAVDEINKSGWSLPGGSRRRGARQNDPAADNVTDAGFLDDGRLINVIGTGDGRTAAASVVNSGGGLSLGALNTYPTFIEEAGPNSALLVVTDNIQAAASTAVRVRSGIRQRLHVRVR